MSTLTRHAHLPDLFPACGPWVTAALTHGFGDDDADLPVSDLAAEIDVVRKQKLAPLLLHLLGTRRPDWSPAGIDELRRDAFARVARSRAVTVAGRHVVASLAAAGIESVVTKGVGLAAHYRWPRLRTSTDVDLLVATSQFRAAFQLLTGEQEWGELARSLQPWPGFHRWCREAANLVATNGDCVDLHHRPSPWLWADRLDYATVASGAVEIDGTTAACGADNLAIAALQLIGDHAAPGTKLIAWRDIAELGASLDPAGTAARLHVTRTAGVVAWLAAQLPPRMRPRALLTALPHARPERPIRLDLMLTTAQTHHPMASHAVRLPATNAAVFLAGSVIPSPGFRRQRTGLRSNAGRALHEKRG